MGAVMSTANVCYLFEICRMVWLLDDHWDHQHRVYFMSVQQREFQPLKIRSHGVNLGGMRYDERYTPYVRETGLLPFIQLVSRSTPPLNAVAITALVDRWRPEAHSFHLRTGEMTVTLQDIAMITGLPIEGNPLCMSTNSDGWREQMHALIDMVPPEPREPEAEDKKKERVAVGAPFTWIAWNFGSCPEDANEDEVKTYARFYMWYVISRTMFADGSSKNAPWMWLKALTVFDSEWSWGSATLAYLYRQVDRPQRTEVEWEPYEKGDSFGNPGEFVLNPVCLRDRLDRRRQRKIKDWDRHHRKYIIQFALSVEQAKAGKRSQIREHSPIALNNYLTWFLASTRVEICKPAYDEEILEDPTVFDELTQH
nr:protein MAIN-LIKE 2-like [Aegilops tauschii subsp. strangulata]